MDHNAPDRIEIPPQSASHDGTVIWLHGLGASGDDFVPVVPHLNLPSIRFVFPHAPERPVTLNRGWVMRAWYDIRSLEASEEREDPADIEASHAWITELIDQEVERGLAPHQIVLAGFSQGGAMALHTGLRYPASLGGIIGLSSYLLLPARLRAEAHPANQGTPILLCHGTQDSMVPLAGGQRARELLTELDPERDLLWQDFPMDHEVCGEEIQLIAEWLHQRFQLPETSE
jgi:phospholipase/carboxylesterase